MKDIDFVAIGYPSIDKIIKLETTPCICKTSIVTNKDNNTPYFGGCNVNISYLGSSLGLSTAVVMKVGEDFESSGFEGFLKDKNVILDGVLKIKDDVTSCSYLVMNKEGEHITLFYPGAMDDKYPSIIDEDIIKRSKYGIITVGSPEYNKLFASLCKKHGVKMVLGMKSDFSSFTKEVLEEIISGCEILVMNDSEKEELKKVLKLQHIEDTFKNNVTKIIIVTKGKDGSEIITNINNNIENYLIKVAKPDKVVDTTGVGDAYIAGFMTAYINGKSILKCGRMGSVISSFIIEKMGCLSNIPTLEQAKARYAINYEEEF